MAQSERPPAAQGAGAASVLDRLAALYAVPVVQWLALLALCAAYLQGGLVKLMDFPGAVAEMVHFGVSPPAPMAAAIIALELGGSVLILTGVYRWAGALGLAGFTFLANFLANRFWEVAPPAQMMVANGFFEHISLVGGFLLVAWHDLRRRVP